MIKHTGPGRIEQSEHPSRIMLFNFDIDADRLKPEHERALRLSVIPKLRNGGSVSIVGLTSRTGGAHHNQILSVQRAASVRDFLRREVPAGFSLRQFLGFGDRKAVLDHAKRGEDERYRCVLLFPAMGSLAPLPKIDETTVQEILPQINTEGGVLDTVTQIMDVASGLGSIANLVIDSVLLDLSATVIGAISTILSLPAAWLSGNALAERNGKRVGFAKAIQEMSEPFADNEEAKWPQIKRPMPTFPTPDDFVTVAERSARAGTRQGYELAWSLVIGLESSPKIVTAKAGNASVKIRLSGRRLLWLLQRGYHEDVWRKILQQLGGYGE
jgi:hypothetical protein